MADFLTLDLSEKTHDYVVEHPKSISTKFFCKAMSLEEREKIVKKFTSKSTFHRGQKVEGSTDGLAALRYRWIKSVIDWEGIKGTDGNDMPCTEESKAKVFEKYSDPLCTWVLEQVDVMHAQSVGLEEGN